MSSWSISGSVYGSRTGSCGGTTMAVTLDRAVEASEIVDALKPFGVTQVDVAAVIQVSDRAVRGWRTGDIRPERYDRLAQLRDLVLLLSDSLTPEVSASGCTPKTGSSTGGARLTCSPRIATRMCEARRSHLSTAPTCEACRRDRHRTAANAQRHLLAPRPHTSPCDLLRRPRPRSWPLPPNGRAGSLVRIEQRARCMGGVVPPLRR